MNGLRKQVMTILQHRPGLTAKEIAESLGCDRRSVNSLLHGDLRSRVRQDRRYRWYPADSSEPGPGATRSPTPDTQLSRICGYYLDCLAHDDLGGVSEFASSKFDDLGYAQVDGLFENPEATTSLLDTPEVRNLLGRLKRDRNRKALYLGFPTRLNEIRARSGWVGFCVQPILLFPFRTNGDGYWQLEFSGDAPQLNFKALQGLTNVTGSQLLEEAITLAEELGITVSAESQPELDEMTARLRELRPEWDWMERIDPTRLTTSPAIADLSEQGIYNRAVVISAERSWFTYGLETELEGLRSVPEATYSETALGRWLASEVEPPRVADEEPLLEVLPPNTEQRQAVHQSLANPLTVITGPPGTGKSQVVTSILMNAAWQGKTVLFASKNNKAIDVVESRINALGPRPVLLRVGVAEYQAILSDYLTRLLAGSAAEEDRQDHDAARRVHDDIIARSQELDEELKSLVDLRNRVDEFERRVEGLRSELGDGLFLDIRRLDRNEVECAARKIVASIDGVDPEKRSLLDKLTWRLTRTKRRRRLCEASEAFRGLAERIGAPPPVVGTGLDVGDWLEYRDRVTRRVAAIREAGGYFDALDELGKARSLEEVSRQRAVLNRELVGNSETLWQTWLRLLPSRFSPDMRQALGNFASILQMIVTSNKNNQRVGRNVQKQYAELFPRVMPVLPCWAVTSLSARGRIPMTPGFFDLVVIDEASQCDIASALPLLFRARRAVVIGDPMQLRHISSLSRAQDEQLLTDHGLITDRPGWSYSTRSLFDLASSLCGGEDIIALRDHHRSHADIIDFSNREFYEGRLRVATRYDRLKTPPSDGPAVRWVDVKGQARRPGSGGAINEIEAQALVDEVARLVEQGYQGTVGVVSPFRAQANRIRDLATQHASVGSCLDRLEFMADTVHRFQGDERDVMLFSPVVAAGIDRRALGFLRSSPNLFNVAVTRARAALIVVGDRAAASRSDVGYLESFSRYVGTLAADGAREDRGESCVLGPDYPHVARPELVSEWERLLYRDLFRAGLRPIPQYNVEKYILDFAIFDGDRRLDIEVDGERYHRNWDGELCRRDQLRNQRLMELGWDVLRFWVYQVRDERERCVRRVQQWLREGER